MSRSKDELNLQLATSVVRPSHNYPCGRNTNNGRFLINHSSKQKHFGAIVLECHNIVFFFHIRAFAGRHIAKAYDLRRSAKKRKFFEETSFIPGESCVKNWRRLEKSNFLAQVCKMFFI